MGEEPKFGVNAKKAPETKKPPLVAKPDLETPKFGVQASPNSGAKTDKTTVDVRTEPVPQMTTEKPKFGADANGPRVKNQASLGQWVKTVFTLQPMGFWVKQYAYGILALLIYTGLTGGQGMALNIVNLLLYPFTVTILQEIGRGKGQRSTISSFFFGFSIGMIGSSIWWIVIYGVIRFLIFMFKYMFSILIGGIGLIYMIVQARKLNI
ncbi:hypothetical protein [Lacticaseibacillus sp. GG6-2]